MDKWRPQLDSARQIGLRRVPHEVLRVVVDAPTGGEICWAEFRRSESGRMFSMAERQPVVVWTNGGHGWIQRAE